MTRYQIPGRGEDRKLVQRVDLPVRDLVRHGHEGPGGPAALPACRYDDGSAKRNRTARVRDVAPSRG